MEFSPSDFVSVNEILADVLKIVGDTELKKNSKGWYTSQVQQALEKLSFDTFFLEITKTVPIPEDLRVDLPKGSFNLGQLYVHNGDQCNFGTAAIVYHKKNFINSPSGDDYLARDRWDNRQDPFHKHRAGNVNGRRFNSFEKNIPDHVHFYGIQNGVIMLSPSVRCFENLTMVYNGVHTSIGDTPVVPTYLREAVKGYVAVEALEVRVTEEKAEFAKWMTILNMHKAKLNDPYEGTWVTAERRVKKLDRKHRQDMKEYFHRMNY